MRVFNKVTLAVGAFCLAGVLAGASVHAATIYADDFSGLSADSLNGTTPDTNPSGETWASAVWTADGVKSGYGSANAFLPFVPEAGKVYTLSADVNTTGVASINGNTQDWLAIGFAKTASTTSNLVVNNSSAWMLIRAVRGGGGIQTFPGEGTAGGTGNHTASSGVVELKVVLDTTSALWSVEWFANDTSLRTFTYTANPTINYVGFGAIDSAEGTVDNFSLTVVPEPATAGLLAIAGLLALRRRRMA